MILNPTFKKTKMNKFSSSNYSGNIRLIKEFKDVAECPDYEGIQLFGFVENMIHGVLEGPPDTFYENGFFQFTLIYPIEAYPFKPPQFYFKTQIFHPNIDQYGLVSVDILQDKWAIYMSLVK